MNIPTEIIAALVTVVGAGVTTAIGFVFVKLGAMDARLARIEEHLQIETFNRK